MKQFTEVWKIVTDRCELVQVRPEEMQPIYDRLVQANRPLIVEIGSAHGASSIVFAEAAKQTGGIVICIDPFVEGYEDQEHFGNEARQAFKKNTTGYKCIRSFDNRSNDPGVVAEVWGMSKLRGGVDVLFIDGDHSYIGVKSDCDYYLPLLKHGGLVAFHDYNNVAYSGVKQAADEYTAGWDTASYWDLVVRIKP